MKSTAAPVAIALSLFAQPAFAQDAAPEEEVDLDLETQDLATPGDQFAEDEGNAIVVTGTRILRPETDFPNPVVSVSSEAIQQSGQTNITELLSQTPALVGSETNYAAAGSQARFGGAGVNLLNLRNLGAARTLVLVNGRRHVAGVPGEAAVDINTIPVALIDRVDTLTGGVSAIYGADGVSGVVNFILKDDFEGVDVRGQYGVSDYGDGDEYYAAATVGSNFADGRGNVAASYEYRKQGRIAFGDRPFGQNPGAERLVRNQNDIPDDPDKPDNIFYNDLRYSDSSPDGAVIVDSSLLPLFRGAGQPYEPGIFLSQSGFLAQGGSSTPIADYQGDLQAGTESHMVNLLARYELTDSLELFGEGKYIHSKAFTISQPSFDFYNYVPVDNPFIPTPIRDALVPDNLADFGYPDGVLFSRDNFDLGTRNERISRDLYRIVAGVEGDLTDTTRFEVSYVYGRNDTTYVSENYRLRDRYFAALDAVDEGMVRNGVANGNIVCRVDITGMIQTNNLLDVLTDLDPLNDVVVPQTFTPGDGSCQPLNIFGEGVASAEALNFINVDLRNKFTLQQHVATGYISGDFGEFLELPGGPIRFAVGVEYRNESSDNNPDDIATTSTSYDPNAPVLQDLALLADEHGSFDVIEGFAELNVSVLSDVPWAERLDFGGAVRISDYSTVGTTTTWKVDGVWAPIRDISFRGSYSVAVRAPNITELYAPTTGAFFFLTDPCSPINVNQGTQYREDNCRALIEGLGVDYDTFDFESSIQASASLLGRAAGNPELGEEKATTWTAGVVLRPDFLRGFNFTFDWYDINIENAINTATLQETTEFCVDSPTLDNVFCDNVTRSPINGYVSNYIVRPENVAFFETAGADMTVGYYFEPEDGQYGNFALQGTLGYLDKLRFLPANAGQIDDDRGEAGSPKWIGTGDITWELDAFTLNYGLNYVGEQYRFELDEIAADPDIAPPRYIKFRDVFTHDIRAQYAFGEDGQYIVYAGINNFTNEKPDRGSPNFPVSYLGRFFYGGVRISLDRLGL